MSWSIKVEDATPGDALVLLRQEKAKFLEGYSSSPDELRATDDQMERTIQSAGVALRAVGPYRVSIGLSGHANPDHAPRKGYSNDVVSISISSSGDNAY